jgi:hypothetical protein
VGKSKERDHSEDRGVDGMELKWILEGLAGGGGVEWIKLSQDRDRWRALVNTVMNLRFWHWLVWSWLVSHK